MFAVGWGANQFTPLLIAYRDELGMSVQTRAFLFGVYAAGLVPRCFSAVPPPTGGDAGPWSSPFVALRRWPACAARGASTLGRRAGAGRLLAGAAPGWCFSAATAWVAELSASEPEGTGAGRERGDRAVRGLRAGPLWPG